MRLDSDVPGVAQGLLLTIRPKMMLDVWVQQGQIRQISAAGGGEEVTIELTDLGAGVAIAAPDPDSTITAGQFDEYEAHADAG